MTIKSHISDPGTGARANVQCCEDDVNALVVATKEYQPYTNFFAYFTNETYGNDMAVNAVTTGTPLQIHNGNDSVLWTGTQIAGGSDIDFSSTNQAYAGTQSVYWNRPEVGDTAEFDNGSDITISDYDALSLWVYNQNNNYTTDDEVLIYWWDGDSGTQVGTGVPLQAYIDINLQDTWQQAVIPLVDMDISTQTTVDTLRMQVTAQANSKIRIYMDNIQLEEDGPEQFIVAPSEGEKLFVTKFQLTFADVYAGTVLNGTMPSIPYDAFLGFTPTNGINLQRKRKGEIGTNVIWTSIIDIMNQSNATITGQGSDGTNSWFSVGITFERPLILEDLYKDNFTIILSDDWSQLLHFKVSIGGYRIEPE